MDKVTSYSGEILDTLKQFWNPAHWFGALCYALLFLGIAHALSRVVHAMSQRILAQKNRKLVDPTVVLFLTQFFRSLIYIFIVILYFHLVPALNRLGTALLTGVSVMSVVFGLAAQNTLSNLVAGCTLLLYRPFHIDDLIQVATPTGTEVGIVEHLTLGYTMIRTLDDRLVVVPNSLMATQVSLNLNRRSLHVMTIVSVGISDNSRMADVYSALMDAARHNPKIRKVIGIHSQKIEDDGTLLSLRAWCSSGTDAETVHNEVIEFLRQRFPHENFLSLALSPVPAAALPPAS